jgi:hypothetical protein
MSDRRFVVRKAPIQTSNRLRSPALNLGEGVGKVGDLSAEIKRYTDVLLGRVDPPMDAGVATLMECADAYYARACEIDILIHEGEREFEIGKGDPLYKFRTGELRSFLELTKRAQEMGSRRITLAQLMMQGR